CSRHAERGEPGPPVAGARRLRRALRAGPPRGRQRRRVPPGAGSSGARADAPRDRPLPGADHRRPALALRPPLAAHPRRPARRAPGRPARDAVPAPDRPPDPVPPPRFPRLVTAGPPPPPRPPPPVPLRDP